MKPQSLKPDAFGRLAPRAMQFVIVPERVVQHETRVTREPIRHRTPWGLPVRASVVYLGVVGTDCSPLFRYLSDTGTDPTI
eukprot:1186777-Prorocentrum_minimum.AAC.1